MLSISGESIQRSGSGGRGPARGTVLMFTLAVLLLLSLMGAALLLSARGGPENFGDAGREREALNLADSAAGLSVFFTRLLLNPALGDAEDYLSPGQVPFSLTFSETFSLEGLLLAAGEGEEPLKRYLRTWNGPEDPADQRPHIFFWREGELAATAVVDLDGREAVSAGMSLAETDYGDNGGRAVVTAAISVNASSSGRGQGLGLPANSIVTAIFRDLQAQAARDCPPAVARPASGEKSGLSRRPVTVGPPPAPHHLLYGDFSYLKFRRDKSRRRQVTYQGSGDGFFRALNLGFYRPAADGRMAWLSRCPENPQLPALAQGAEIWSFSPPALQSRTGRPDAGDEPDLEFYYLKTIAQDIKETGNEEGPAAWRTVLIGGLAFKDGDKGAAGGQFFAFDVTDPESAPLPLWTFSHRDLGPHPAPPALIANQGRWYALIAGRDASTGRAIISVLDALSGQLIRTIDSGLKGAWFTASFQPVAPDYLVEKRGSDLAAWSTPLVYFSFGGRAEATGEAQGGVYRLKLTDSGSDKSPPRALPPDRWELGLLFEAGQPVAGAVNSALDPAGNRWVVFGTAGEGAGQYFFGLKEPLNQWGYLSFEPVAGTALLDVSAIEVYEDGRLKPLAEGGRYQQVRDRLRGDAYSGYRREMRLGDDPAGCPEQPLIEGLPLGASLTAFTSHAVGGDGRSRSALNLIDTFTGLPDPYLKSLAGQLDAGDKVQGAGGRSLRLLSGRLDAGEGPAGGAFAVKTDHGSLIKNISRDGSENAVFLAPGLALDSGLISWRQVLDTGLALSEEDLASGILP